jgi:hypothetical protein
MSLHGGRERFWFGIAAAFVLFGLGLGVYYLVFRKSAGPPSDPPKSAFAGSSEALQQSVVLPTLDTPIPANKSAIWCSSFQLAWNHLMTDVAQGPIQLKDAQILADRLNQAGQSDSDLDARDFYAAAGFAKDGIIQRIQTEMGRKFPDSTAPTFDVPADGAIAYAFMRTQVKFTVPFFDNDEAFRFTDSLGRQTLVKSFGIREKDEGAYRKLREQVRVLYWGSDNVALKKDEMGEFVIDPCRDSQPYQIILASIGRQPTLGEAIIAVRKKLATKPADEFESRFQPVDSLLIPTMHLQINHQFKELEGKQFLNPTLNGLYLNKALQTIQFRLDRSGAELSSEARIELKGGPNQFYFNRPYLLILKKRAGNHPFLVMWVDNAELLDK